MQTTNGYSISDYILPENPDKDAKVDKSSDWKIGVSSLDLSGKHVVFSVTLYLP